MVKLKRFGEAVEAALNGAIQDVVADFDAESAKELRVDFVFDGEFAAVVFGEAGLHFLALCGIKCGGTLDHYRAASLFETREALDRSEDGLEITWFRGDEFGNQIP